MRLPHARLVSVAAAAVLVAAALVPSHRIDQRDHSGTSIKIALTDIALGEYSFDEGSDGSWSAPNRAQGLRTRADATGVYVAPRGPAPARWKPALRLRGFGRKGALLPVPPAVVRVDGARVEQVRASLGLTEWYVNEPRGIEQGFTISRPPPAGDPGSPIIL